MKSLPSLLLPLIVLATATSFGADPQPTRPASQPASRATTAPTSTTTTLPASRTTATTSRPAEMMTPATFNPARIRMKIESLQVATPKTGAQCIGSFTVVNTGPGYEKDPDHVLPYWTLTIADSKGALLYTGSGAWSGPMTTGGRISLHFDTHSNSLPAPPDAPPGAQGKPFLFPAPDKYAVTMTLFPGRDLQTPVDTKTLTVEVPKPAPPTTTRTSTRPATTRTTTTRTIQPR